MSFENTWTFYIAFQLKDFNFNDIEWPKKKHVTTLNASFETELSISSLKRFSKVRLLINFQR